MRDSKWRWPLFIIMINAVLGVVVVGDAWVMKSMQDENHMLIQELGTPETASINDRALRWYNQMFVDNDLVADSYKGLLTAGDNQQLVHDVGAAAASQLSGGMVNHWFTWRLQVFWMLVYQSLLRLSLAMTWVPVGLCLVVPAFIDGFMRRRIKQSNFDIASPDRFGFAVLAMQLMVAGYILVMFLPFPLPPIAPLACFALTAVCVRTGMANLHK